MGAQLNRRLQFTGTLRERLRLYREGVRLAPERGLTLCRGTDRCEEPIPEDSSTPLPAGNYVVHAEIDFPPDGVWDLELGLDCVALAGRENQLGMLAVERHTALRLQGTQENHRRVLEAPFRIKSPRVGSAARCTIKLEQTNERMTFLYRFLLPGTESP